MNCRICDQSDLIPLWKADGHQWFRCLSCGSDSSDGPYYADLYASGFVAGAIANTGGMDRARLEVQSNCDWFGKGPGDFLDVGCCEGAVMMEMAARGWSVHGFDVTEDARQPGCTTINQDFRANLFPRQYDAVLCREVIEHVPDWKDFLGELVRTTRPGGRLQIQTPRPLAFAHPTVYQRSHLHIISPAALELAIVNAGCRVADRRFWSMGQAWMLRV